MLVGGFLERVGFIEENERAQRAFGKFE